VDGLDLAQDAGRGLCQPPTLFPTQPRWENYSEMWNALPFDTFFVNSVKLALLNTVGQLISCSMAAYAFAALRFRFRGHCSDSCW